MDQGDGSIGHVRPFIIVTPQPIGGSALSMVDGFDQMLIQPFVSHSTAEPFNKRVLSRFSWLVKHQSDALFLCPRAGFALIAELRLIAIAGLRNAESAAG